MNRMGSEHGLYSFELVVTTANLPGDTARCGVPVAGGLLIVRRGLLLEAKRVSSLACYRALHRGLALHRPHAGALAVCGLDAQWAGHMAAWGERLLAADEGRARLHHEAALAAPRRRELLEEAGLLWQRLGLSLRLAGLDEVIVPGPRPRGGLALMERLLQLADQIDHAPHAGRLGQFGFGPAERARLREIAAAIGPARHAHARLRAACRAAGGPLLTIRGALLGDLARLCDAAQTLLPPILSAPLRMRRLLGRR
jgi:hypothetical protein